ncbi:MAG: hypothetical protein IPO15_27480 [Anaerolineae bacterium]|uniref:hypothetical protein n=1 Tax=Candidatus Amarolinea dominans TaxID=3140696 RepID=UPI003134C192|nr:hypothetical protein [Anaerolineae bacterium]
MAIRRSSRTAIAPSSATLALYQEMIAFSQSTGFARYHPIPLTAQNNYLYNKLYTFAHTSTSANPQPRRRLADDLRAWALQTRQETRLTGASGPFFHCCRNVRGRRSGDVDASKDDLWRAAASRRRRDLRQEFQNVNGMAARKWACAPRSGGFGPKSLR